MTLLDICKKVVDFSTLVVSPCFVLSVFAAMTFGIVGATVGILLILAETYVHLQETSYE